MVCRDRNRIAMQSDILGATALGLRNLLCLSGDHQVLGNHPYAKNVYDIDSIQLLGLVKRMRDQNRLLGHHCRPPALRKILTSHRQFVYGQISCIYKLEPGTASA